jgi:hypothetical protein
VLGEEEKGTKKKEKKLPFTCERDRIVKET